MLVKYNEAQLNLMGIKGGIHSTIATFVGCSYDQDLDCAVLSFQDFDDVYVPMLEGDTYDDFIRFIESNVETPLIHLGTCFVIDDSVFENLSSEEIRLKIKDLSREAEE